MKLKHLRATNFRCFKSIELDLHPQLNVVVGSNGAGKTAFLVACRNAIGSFINCLPIVWTEQANLSELDINYSMDVHSRKFIRADELSIDFTTIEPELNGKRLLKKRLSEQKTKGSFKVTGNIRGYAKEFNAGMHLGLEEGLPVLLFLGTERFKIDHKNVTRRSLGERYEGYFNALKGTSATYKVEEWFYRRDIGEFQNSQQELGLDFSDIVLLRKAVGEFYPDAERIYYNIDVKQMVLVLKSGEHKPLSDLSDGERFMLLTCITIAFYCFQLNLHLGEQCLKKSTGTVMIDEIDLHLHPKWQREILPKLLRVFPCIQFIVTTHSPQVLSSVKRENLLFLNNFEILSSEEFIEGRDSNSILRDVFDLTERPQHFHEKVKDFYRLLADKKLDSARKELNHLKEHFGANDAEIIRAELFLADEL
jgi:predicted ATP-binding protein involved in virulence